MLAGAALVVDAKVDAAGVGDRTQCSRMAYEWHALLPAAVAYRNQPEAFLIVRYQ